MTATKEQLPREVVSRGSFKHVQLYVALAIVLLREYSTNVHVQTMTVQLVMESGNKQNSIFVISWSDTLVPRFVPFIGDQPICGLMNFFFVLWTSRVPLDKPMLEFRCSPCSISRGFSRIELVARA